MKARTVIIAAILVGVFLVIFLREGFTRPLKSQPFAHARIVPSANLSNPRANAGAWQTSGSPFAGTGNSLVSKPNLLGAPPQPPYKSYDGVVV